MTEEQTIVIGCDHNVTLALLLDLLKEQVAFPVNVISASRISDLLSIVKSLDPALVVMGFRNNQNALNDFNQFIKNPDIPVLCLTQRQETTALSWRNDRIVFTYPVENLNKKGQLIANIQSIFLLRTSQANPIPDAQIQFQQSHNDRNMSRYVLELDQKVEVLLSIKDRIKTLITAVDDSTRAELLSIVHAIRASASDTKIWDDFKLYFEKTNPNFLLSLSEKHPKLTPKDLKYCCYLKMNMSNDDIRNLLGINQESVRTHKYRLKKKMDLDKDLDLLGYVKSIEIPRVPVFH